MYNHVLCLIGNPGNDALPLQLCSVCHNTCDGVCTRCSREENAKRELGQQEVAKERLSII